MMIRLTTIACLALIAATGAQAQTYRAENTAMVAPATGGFAVLDDAGFGARGMWCAAADYARNELGASGVQRLYIAEGRTPGIGQRAPVVFTLNPEGLTPRPVLIVGASLRHAGSSLSVDHAYTFCADSRVINW